MGPLRQSNFRPPTVQGEPATTGGTPAQLCTFRPAPASPITARRPQPPAARTRQRREGTQLSQPHGRAPKGRMKSNLPFGSGGPGRIASPAHLPHVSALSRPGTRPGIRPVMQHPRQEDRDSGAGFLLPFGRRRSLLGHPVPPGACAPLTIGLPRRPKAARTRAGFPCSARVRRGRGRVPSLPRGPRCLPRSGGIPGRRAPPSNGRSLSSRCCIPSQGVAMTRHQRGFTGVHPSRPFPCL
jgi:hypothetical protein